jgi:hypothetical protein
MVSSRFESGVRDLISLYSPGVKKFQSRGEMMSESAVTPKSR